MTILLLIIILVLQICSLRWKSFFKRKGENAADIDDNREKCYEAEKGKNLATKEDIEQITKSIEKVKNEISYENLRKHNAIQERERRFLNVLHIAESIQMQHTNMFYSMYQVENAAIMLNAIKQTNELIKELHHEYRLIICSYKDLNALEDLNELVNHLQPYVNEICVAATNAASFMTSWKNFMDMYVQSNDRTEKNIAMQRMTNNNQELEQYRKNLTFDEKENVEKAISNYVVFLSRLFKMDFNINYEIPKIGHVKKELE